MTRLTFADETFDAILSFDVLEHVPAYDEALRECWRCLKQGGAFLLSVPFVLRSPRNRLRARLLPDGRVEHLLAPEYHGDPINPEGVLCFNDFGWEFLDELRSCGFQDAAGYFFWSRELGTSDLSSSCSLPIRYEPVVARSAAPMRQPAESHRISVVVPLYNHERYVGPALRSVFSQTTRIHEIIVVDDGSSDRSLDVVADLARNHPEIVLWSKANGGAHAAINAGIHRATGELVAVLNSDDLYHPERLATLLREFRDDPCLDAAMTGLSFVDGDGHEITNAWYENAMAFHRHVGDFTLSLINGNVLMTTSNIVARRQLFDEIGGFSPLRYAHDLDFFLRLVAKKRTFRFLDRRLLTYRVHAENTIAEAPRKVKAEWAAATAFFLTCLWDRQDRGPIDWRQAADLMAVLDRHTLTTPVHMCMAYFRQNPTDTMELNPFHNDTTFRSFIDDVLR